MPGLLHSGNPQSVQYVKICSLYGAGFYYMPGTDTCIKIGGFVRAEMNFNAGGSFAPFTSFNVDDRSTYNAETTRVRWAITADARTQTAYGTLRAYFNIAEQVTNGGGGSGVDTWANRGFIQLAGFTAGLTDSFFDFDNNSYSNQTNRINSSVSGGGIPVFAYTAQFGNGLSASVSVEDTSARSTNILAPTAGNDGYAGRELPDFVGNLRIDQAWGSAQVMGAVHQVRPLYYDAVTDAHPDDEVGWAVGAGLKLNVPMLGKGDYAIAQFNYAEGAMDYVGAGMGTYSIREGFRPVTSTAFGPFYDATFGVGTDLDLTKGWSVTAGFEHHWVPGWKTSLYGAFASIMYSDTSAARLAARNAVAGSTDADFQYWQVGSRTVWSPVQNLDLSVEVMYNNVNTAFDGGTSATLGTFEDKSWWQGMFRVQRNFYP